MSGDSKIDSPKNVFLKSGENKAESPDLTSKKPMLHNKDEDANQVQLKVMHTSKIKLSHRYNNKCLQSVDW